MALDCIPSPDDQVARLYDSSSATYIKNSWRSLPINRYEPRSNRQNLCRAQCPRHLRCFSVRANRNKFLSDFETARNGRKMNFAWAAFPSASDGVGAMMREGVKSRPSRMGRPVLITRELNNGMVYIGNNLRRGMGSNRGTSSEGSDLIGIHGHQYQNRLMLPMRQVGWYEESRVRLDHDCEN